MALAQRLRVPELRPRPRLPVDQCYRCNRQTSITAGTIFEATKLPLTVWFQGIYPIVA